jgi:hypothetical protein
LFVRSHPRRHLPFPRHRVEGHRHRRQEQRATEPILTFSYVSGLLSKVRVDCKSGSCSFQIFKAFLSLLLDIVGGFRRRIWKVGNYIGKRESMAVDVMLLCLHFLLISNATRRQYNVGSKIKIYFQISSKFKI